MTEGLCACGCGMKTTFYRGKYRKYISGHNSKNNPNIKKTQFKKGHIPYNKSISLNNKRKEEMSIIMTELWKNEDFRNKVLKRRKEVSQIAWNKGLKKEDNQIIFNLSQNLIPFKSGNIPWNKGKTGKDDERISSKENHYNWKGGLSFEEYPQEFNNSLKQQIRDKYNNCDYISGIHKDICSPNRELDVHHIDYDKKNSNLNNLIPLNKSNHIKTNSNRLFWERLFIYSLEIDEWYYEVK